MKPGYLTTEFWLTIANTVFMGLVAFGALGSAEAEEVQGLVAPLIGAVVPIAVYIWGRAQVKRGVG